MAKKVDGSITRRGFVKVVGGGLAVAAAGPTLLLPKRAWAAGAGPIRIGNLEALILLLQGQSEHTRAAEFCRRWLAIEPSDEKAHRALMRVHALAGDRPAALRQYDGFVRAAAKTRAASGVSPP